MTESQKIRVLIVDQMGVLRSERRKYQALAEFPDLDVTVIVPRTWRFNYRLHSCEEQDGSEKYTLRPLPVTNPGFSHRAFYTSSLSKTLRELQPQIIHLFQEPYSLFALQFAFLRNRIIPRAKLLFITWQNIYFANYPFQFSKLYNIFEKYVFRNTDLATPITEAAESVLIRRGYAGKSHILNWGIDSDLFRQRQDREALRQKLNLDESFVIGYVGRFVQEKGLLDLVEAFLLFDENMSLMLVGDGPLKPEIERIRENEQIGERMVLVPSVSNTEINRYLACMDVLILPSRETPTWKEQLGKVLLEAMACEVPVIGANSGEIPRVISDAGLVFEEGNVRDLHNKIKAVKENPEEASRRMERGKSRVASLYSWPVIARQQHIIYSKLTQHLVD